MANVVTSGKFSSLEVVSLLKVGENLDIQAGEKLTLTSSGTITPHWGIDIASIGLDAPFVSVGTIGGNVGMYGVELVPRATTSITSGLSNNSATWNGYTIGQVVKALQDIGILT